MNDGLRYKARAIRKIKTNLFSCSCFLSFHNRDYFYKCTFKTKFIKPDQFCGKGEKIYGRNKYSKIND